MKGAATAERVLGPDGRFYSPRKHPEHHRKVVAAISRENKINRIEEIEDEMKELRDEVKHLKREARVNNNHIDELTIENKKLMRQLGMTATMSDPAEIQEIELAKDVLPKKEIEMLLDVPMEDDGPAEADESLIRQAREGGKGVSAGETAKFEENVTGGKAPKAKGKSFVADVLKK